MLTLLLARSLALCLQTHRASSAKPFPPQKTTPTHLYIVNIYYVLYIIVILLSNLILGTDQRFTRLKCNTSITREVVALCVCVNVWMVTSPNKSRSPPEYAARRFLGFTRVYPNIDEFKMKRLKQCWTPGNMSVSDQNQSSACSQVHFSAAWILHLSLWCVQRSAGYYLLGIFRNMRNIQPFSTKED